MFHFYFYSFLRVGQVEMEFYGWYYLSPKINLCVGLEERFTCMFGICEDKNCAFGVCSTGVVP